MLDGVDIDLGGDRYAVGLSYRGWDLHIVHNLLNVDFGRVLNGHLLGDLRVSADGSEHFFARDNWFIEGSNVTAKSGLQDLRRVASNDGSMFVVDCKIAITITKISFKFK